MGGGAFDKHLNLKKSIMKYSYLIVFILICCNSLLFAQYTGGRGDGHGSGGLLNYTYDNGSWSPETPKSASFHVDRLPNNLYVKSGKVVVGNALTANRVELSPGAYLICDSNNLSLEDSLILLADSTGYASFKGKTQAKTRVQQYVAASGWTHMGLPLNNAQLSAFGTVNTAVHANTRNIYYWDESSGSWQDPVGSGDGSAVANVEGKGYVVWVGNYGISEAESVVECAGALPEQISPPSLTNNGTSNDVNKDGWNLVANPFACPLDFSRINTSDLLSSFSIWDPSKAKYLHYSPLVGDLISPLIAPMQGFWVKASGPNPSLGSSLNVLTHCASSDDHQFYKTNFSQIDRFQLIVSELHNRSVNDEIVIGLIPGTKDSLDAEWDAFKRPNGSFAPTLAMEVDGQSLGINALDFDPSRMHSKQLLLSFNTSNHHRIYRFQISTGLMHQSLSYFLEDKLMNEWHDLNKAPYDFIHDTLHPRRFILHFQNNQHPNNLNLNSPESSKLQYRLKGTDLLVWGQTSKAIEGAIYSLNGQQVFQFQYDESSSEQHYQLPDFKSGIYLLKLGVKVYKVRVE